MKVKCVNGHEFDPSLTPGGVCPQCGEMGKVQDFDSSGMTLPPINSGFPSFGATEPAPGWNAQAGGGDGQKTTFPGGGSFQNYGETMPAGAAWQQNAAQGSSFQEYGATMPANAVPGGETVPPTGGWPNAKSASHYPGVENYDGLTMPLGGIRSGAVRRRNFHNRDRAQAAAGLSRGGLAGLHLRSRAGTELSDPPGV